jgi:hypothetical protein
MPGAEFKGPDWPDFPGEPEGWRDLQERAQSEQDPRKLEAIIAEMNRLLSECEKKAAAGEAPQPSSRPGSDKPKPTSIPE